MFGLGIWEIMAILIVAIVFINPKDLPKIARKIGHWYSRMKDMGKWIANPAHELEEELKRPLSDLEEEIKRPVQEFGEEVKDNISEIETQSGNVMWENKLPDLSSVMPSSSNSFLSQEEEQETENQESDT